MSNPKMSKEEYIHSMHNFGRFGAISAIVIMLGMPTIAGIYFNAMPEVAEVLKASLSLLAVFIPVTLSEVISYSPILGSSIYLTLITGNVLNLKLPVANNAMNLLDVQYGTEDADIVSSIAVSVSSFTTIIIVALGVILMIPLQPVLTIPAVKISTAYILPALFGAMATTSFGDGIGGGVRAKGRLKGALIPVIIVAAVTLLDKLVLHKGIMSLYQGFMIIAMLPIAYFGTKMLYKQGAIQVLLPGEESKGKETAVH